MSERWQEAFDLQLRLLRAVEQHRVVSTIGIRERLGFSEAEKNRVFRDLEDALREANPVFVSGNVNDLWLASWEEFKPEEFHPSDPFVPTGFALLPEPTVLGDKGEPMQALAWKPDVQGGHIVWGFAETTELSVREGLKLGERVIPPEEAREMLEQGGFFPWVIAGFFLLRWQLADAQDFSRALQAFWRLGREFVRAQERIPRASRREGQRARIEQEHVTVLRLRRTAPTRNTEEPQAVDWRCQWVVRGHWRNQWYPSEGRHKQRFIAPYVKGPPDKPLRITERVVEFVR